MEAADPGDFKVLFALFRNHLLIDDLGLHLVRADQGPGLIHIPPMAFDPLLFTFHIELLEAEIRGQETIFVFRLQMISQRIPAVVLRTVDYAGPQQIQIDICQAVDQCFAFVDNHAFETIAPKIAPAVVAPVVVPCRAYLDFPHEFGKTGQFSRQ